MSHASRLRQALISSLIAWLALGGLLAWLLYNQVAMWQLAAVAVLFALVFILNLAALNASQQQLSDANKAHSSTKRLVQEAQLKLDRFEYDAKKAVELRRIVLNSTQEKDHALQNMAAALDHAMDEMIELAEQGKATATKDQIIAQAKAMKQYAFDLKTLARLELKAELPELEEMNFNDHLPKLLEEWTAFAKPRNVVIKIDNPEEQMPIVTDVVWLGNLLSRVTRALIRMNKNSKLVIHVIGYLDADLGDALRINFVIDGRVFDDSQLKRLTTEYVGIVEEGQEVGPGLTFVVARRMAQLLNGHLDIASKETGIEVLLVLPRNPFRGKEEQDY